MLSALSLDSHSHASVVPAPAELNASDEGKTEFAYLGCYGVSAHARELRAYIQQVAQQSHPVLLQGEVGLQPSELARAIHQAGTQAGQPFVAFNTRALSESALHQLLFGESNQLGLLDSLPSGTVFLNELTCLSSRTHQRLAVYLEERRWLRRNAVGPRLVFATNTDSPDVLAPEIASEGWFMQGVLALLRPHRFLLLPLRTRREDVSLIAEKMLQRLALSTKGTIVSISNEALGALIAYDWPENLAEMQGVLSAALAQMPPQLVTDECLPGHIRFARLRTLPASGVDLTQLVEAYERNWLAEALRQTGNSQTKAARLLGIRAQTLNVKLKRMAEQGKPLL